MHHVAGFSELELEHYSRHLKLSGFGVEKQRRLQAARVLIVGAGGLGCPAALYLAAAGVGTIGILDFDRVERSNLQRQVAHSVHTLGHFKTDSLLASLNAINPFIHYNAHAEEFTAENSGLVADYDLVLDGTDNFTTRFLIADACFLHGVPLLQGAVHAFDAQLSLFIPQQTACYRCLFEAPPARNALAPCADFGVLGVVPGTLGVMMATEAIKHITGLPGSIAGELLTYDSLQQSIKRLTLAKNEDCPLCGPSPRIQSVQAEVTAACPSQESTHSSPEPAAWILTPEQVAQDLDYNDIQILDVRDAFEVQQGHLPNAQCLPLWQLTEASIQAQGFLPTSEHPLLVYCQKGMRSLEAVKMLRAWGYANAYSLAGGLENWNGPVVVPAATLA